MDMAVEDCLTRRSASVHADVETRHRRVASQRHFAKLVQQLMTGHGLINV
jgi:hypothetical protein